MYQKAFQAKHIVASLKEEKSTLAFVVTEKMKQTLIIICRDADVDGFPIISSISLQLHGEYFCQVYNSCYSSHTIIIQLEKKYFFEILKKKDKFGKQFWLHGI